MAGARAGRSSHSAGRDRSRAELASGRLFEVAIKTSDRQRATLAEFVEALDLARQEILRPVED
jgi:hypothetical protein